MILIGPNVGDAVKACFSIFIENLQFPFEVIKRSREDEASLNPALGIAGVHIENQFDMIARVLDPRYFYQSSKRLKRSIPDLNHMAIEHYIRYYIKQILLTYLTLLNNIYKEDRKGKT